MTYLAIARKWRPTTFDEIVGQRHVTRTLRNAIELGRIHHAYLFTGSRGVGKTSAARVLARALECEEGPTPDPCGRCVLCRSILAGSCPDVVEIDGASNNSVDDVRELREGVRYMPSMGRYRIYIIDEVHMLTRPAFNALLKTLEEPPPHVVFVFATTEPQKIPETILSRVQRFDFKRIPVGPVVERLRQIADAEGIQVSDTALRLVARAGDGSMRDAQSLLDQVIAFSGVEVGDAQVTDLLGLVDRSLLFDMLRGLVRGEPARCLDAIASVHEYGYEIGQFTAELLDLLRNAALVALAPDHRRYLDASDEEVEQLRAIVEGLSADVFARWFDVLLEVHDRVARAAEPRQVLEMAVARLASTRPQEGLDRVMARLEDLDRRLRQAGHAPGVAGRRLPESFRDAVPQPPVAGRSAPPPSRPISPPPPAPMRPASPVSPARTDPLPLPSIAQVLDVPGRWEAVLDVLPEDSAWADLLDHSAVLGFDEGVLRVGFSSAFHHTHGRDRLLAPELRPVLDAAFSGLRRVESQVRPAGGPPTRSERRQRERAERDTAVQQAVRADPRIEKLARDLGATLVDVLCTEEEER
ncbi:MAG: DNA polymerase III subunit gamma/tau [Deltaproteobacteria bacterium]|nr:DNA polymerase III subunit gamma/tau [Deltaproteobacteria bacterium]